LLIGLALNFIHLDPIRALFIAAVINGFLASPVMARIMLLTRDSRIMGKFHLPAYLQVFGWLGTLVMGAASVALLVQLF
jgi:Mn2+/Fe2+ NRAMP family transporter